MDDPDEWLEGVRRWFYGGTEPGEPGASANEGKATADTLPGWPAPNPSGTALGSTPGASGPS